MKPPACVCILYLTMAALAAGDQETFAPPVLKLEQYRHIWEKSPFVAEAAVVKEPGGGLAQRFVLTGLATLRNEPVVFVLDRQSLARLVVSRESKPGGLEVISVENNNDPKQASATLRLGNEQGVIRYDLAALQSINQSPENAEPNKPSATVAAPSPDASAPTSATPASATPPPRPNKVIKRTISIK